jgi:PleD family two-component response regulator
MSELKQNILIYMAISDGYARSNTEDLLVLHGFDVSTFSSPRTLWEHFLARPSRFVILDRLFDDGSDGLDFVRKIREKHLSPYVYILVRSTIEQLCDIETALAAGANDYLVVYKVHDPFQVQARLLVGLQWLKALDSLKDGVGETLVQPLAPAPVTDEQAGFAVASS